MTTLPAPKIGTEFQVRFGTAVFFLDKNYIARLKYGSFMVASGIGQFYEMECSRADMLI